MTKLKRIALAVGVFMGVFTFGHAWNVAEAKIAYLTIEQGKPKVTYHHRDSYTLDVYVPPCSPYDHPCYRDHPCYFYVPGYLGYPHFGFLRVYLPSQSHCPSWCSPPRFFHWFP